MLFWAGRQPDELPFSKLSREALQNSSAGARAGLEAAGQRRCFLRNAGRLTNDNSYPTSCKMSTKCGKCISQESYVFIFAAKNTFSQRDLTASAVDVTAMLHVQFFSHHRSSTMGSFGLHYSDVVLNIEHIVADGISNGNAHGLSRNEFTSHFYLVSIL